MHRADRGVYGGWTRRLLLTNGRARRGGPQPSTVRVIVKTGQRRNESEAYEYSVVGYRGLEKRSGPRLSRRRSRCCVGNRDGGSWVRARSAGSSAAATTIVRRDRANHRKFL